VKTIVPITITDDVLVSSTIAEDDYAAWSSGTSYTLGQRVIYVSTDVHQVYESVYAGSQSGHDPTLDTTNTWWLLVGSTGRWSMFDASVSEQSTDDGTITVKLLTRERYDSIALFNLSAASLTVSMVDGTAGTVYSSTTSLTSTSGITDWWAYFFAPVERRVDYFLTGLPLYPDAELTITLTEGGTVAVGEIVVGLSRDWGDTQYGAQVGITDYSIKEADDWGNYYITQRAFSKRADLTVWLDNSRIDAFQAYLAGIRATPAVYVGSDSYGALLLYGFYKDFAIDISYPSVSVCSLTVEGLT